MGDLRALRFRIQNFRNVDDSGWIELDRVTALVGRNESGKTALLQALHKFNPARPTPYVPQREFPRDRFQSEYREEKANEIPVSSVTFKIEGELRRTVDALSGTAGLPETITYTRFYGGNLSSALDPPVPTPEVSGEQVRDALDRLASAARRLNVEGEPQPSEENVRSKILAWIAAKKQAIPIGSLRNDAGKQLVATIRTEAETHSQAATADMIEEFLSALDPVVEAAGKPEISKAVEQLCQRALPVFIYFEDYGILDSAVYLPRLIEDIARIPNDARVRTILAMFKHVRLSAKEIHELGKDTIANLGRAPTPEEIAQGQERRELRAIELNSASLDITKKFNEWFHQRRHKIRYHADGDYFRIWVSDDRRPDVEIELESRSRGFQWFFSFYLVFLVESEEGHKDAVLLLDEPGLHLHPTAQQELISFFEELSSKNQLIYTTHSPFLIDGEHLTRVRPVQENAEGQSEVSNEVWPADRETTFPLQAALGYSMMQTLFTGKRNVLVEGLSDYLYLHGMSLLLRADARKGLPDDVFVTPCGGTKLVGHLAALFIGQGVRPLVVLDDDDAGRTRAAALIKDLYKGEEHSVMLVSTAVPDCPEIEDVVGKDAILGALARMGIPVRLSADDARVSGLGNQIKAWSARTGTVLPDGWKVDVARKVVTEWSSDPAGADEEMVDRAGALLDEIQRRV